MGKLLLNQPAERRQSRHGSIETVEKVNARLRSEQFGRASGRKGCAKAGGEKRSASVAWPQRTGGESDEGSRRLPDLWSVAIDLLQLDIWTGVQRKLCRFAQVFRHAMRGVDRGDCEPEQQQPQNSKSKHAQRQA